MKKTFLLWMMMAIAIISATAQKSTISFGDKNSKEIDKSVKEFNGKIKYYDKKILVLEKKNRQLLILCKYSNDLSLVCRYKNQIRANDSLILVSQQKIGEVEAQTGILLASTAGKCDINRIDLAFRKSGRNIKNLAEAYSTIKYIDNLKSNQNYYAKQNVQKDSGCLKGVVVNDWYYEVIAQVTGPANFFREFNIKPNGKSPEFTLPMIGKYTTVFIGGSNVKSISKSVGPNIVYYDGTIAYDYKATLPRY